ncbi:hypothetical protein L873DRAFT_1830503 [Choiromyces venosus 120613-1]|uniref:Uncharacterized protein n=1 Tax=Choiromyces venosus 120613-1 TaxID=1336337 RepID=A0A3N4J6U5_9PEZI|nr:hypothetical protein L873DRAFT_1830503 [Choiromyces venosus 120613-1]
MAGNFELALIDTSCLEPPRKKRRLTRTVALDLFDSPRPSSPEPPHQKTPYTHGGSGYGGDDGDGMMLDELLPVAVVPDVVSNAYDDYVSALPLNILFQVKVANNAAARETFPDALLGHSIRLYYPEFKSFSRFMRDGIVPGLRLESARDVRNIKIIAKKAGEVLAELDILSDGEVWEKAMRELRKVGIGKHGEGGRKMASSVRLVLGLNYWG